MGGSYIDALGCIDLEVLPNEYLAIMGQSGSGKSTLISIQNPDGLLLPGMNAEVAVSIARRENVLSIPVMALRTSRDLTSTAQILGRPEEDITNALRASSDAAPRDPDAPETIELRGVTVELPDGITACWACCWVPAHPCCWRSLPAGRPSSPALRR